MLSFEVSQEGHRNAIISETAYTYNGKELNSDFGLDLHDYGARWYDADFVDLIIMFNNR
jgi:hypothetical protein